MNLKITSVLLSLACSGVTFANAQLIGDIFYGHPDAVVVVSQSTTYDASLGAEKAFDGNTNGNVNDYSVSHTDTGDTSPEWSVSLGSTEVINGVKIWNIVNGANQDVTNRLEGFTLELYRNSPCDGDPPEKVYEHTDNVGNPALDSYEIDIVGDLGEGIAADIVVITGAREYLHMAEVQVYVPHTDKHPKNKSCKAPKASKKKRLLAKSGKRGL